MFWLLNLTLLFSLARRSGEPKIDPVKRVESDEWIKSINKATTVEPASAGALRGTGGKRNLRKLPFSDRTFTEIARRFYIHDSIIRIVSRADVSEFSAASLEMGESPANGMLPLCRSELRPFLIVLQCITSEPQTPGIRISQYQRHTSRIAA
jgi:hypothetical protein